MNVREPEKEKTKLSTIIIYSISIFICIVAIIIVICIQFFPQNNNPNKLENNSQEIDLNILKAEFNNIFNNKLEIESFNTSVKKIEEDKDFIFTQYKKSEEKENLYNIDLNIPKINIENDIIKSYNQEINDTFIKKAENILSTSQDNTIYTVQYSATIKNNILSVIIYSNLKDKISAQRAIVLTYNYDLKNNKAVSLKNFLERTNINISEVEEKTKNIIYEEQKKVEDLKKLGYTVFERNPEDKRYKVENTKEFFVQKNQIYLIYPYGNDNLTTELDLVVISNKKST